MQSTTPTGSVHKTGNSHGFTLNISRCMKVNIPWVLPPPCNSRKGFTFWFDRGFLLSSFWDCYRLGAVPKIDHLSSMLWKFCIHFGGPESSSPFLMGLIFLQTVQKIRDSQTICSSSEIPLKNHRLVILEKRWRRGQSETWLEFVVSTHLKNNSQIRSFPQVRVKLKNLWNHQAGNIGINPKNPDPSLE